MKLRKRLALFALALLLPASALADPKDDARRHFVAGLQSAQEGDYEVALQHFLAAEDAYPHPNTEYNIARAYYDLGDLPNALTYFRLFRDSADPDKAADVEPIIEVIEARLGQQRAETTTPVAPTPGTAGGGGATEEELARLEAIAAEIDALRRTLAERQALPPESAEPTAAEPTEGAETTVGTPEGDEILGEQGFLGDAYERVVVTASRYGQEPIESPATVTILTADDIRLSGATSIPDLLRRVVGVNVMELAAGNTDVSIRGFNRELSNKVLVLIDGRSTYLDFIGTTMWEALPITLEEIERIEVIRGPGSAVYGANAVTGVINIITRTPGEGQNQVTAEGGLPDYAKASALLTGREGLLSYRFSAGYKQHGRWGQDFEISEHSAVEPNFGTDQDLGLQVIQANGRLDGSFAGGEGFASISGGFTRGLYEFYNIGALDDYGWEAVNGYARGDLAYGPVHLRAFWNTDNGYIAPWWSLQGDPRTLATDLDADTIDVELEGQQEFETGEVVHRLNGGIGVRYKRLAEFSYAGQKPGDPPIEEFHYNAFLSEEATMGRFKLVGTMRMDIHPNLDLSQTLSPRGAAIWRLTDTSSLRVTGGSAFRAPTMIENYMDFNLPTGVDGVFVADFGDLDLAPERIITAEVGWHDESTLYHTADVAVYYNRLTNIIALQDVTPSALPYDPEENGYQAGSTGWTNTEDLFQGIGVEAEAEVFPTDGLDVFANVAWTRIVEEDRGRDLSTSALKLNAGAMYRTPYYTDVSADLSYYSPQVWQPREFGTDGALVVTEEDIPARLIVSGRVAVHPTPDENLEIAGAVWNATALFEPRGEQGFQEHPKGQLIGPRAYVSLSYRF